MVVYGDNGGGVAYSFISGNSLEIKDWSDDPNGVCAWKIPING